MSNTQANRRLTAAVSLMLAACSSAAPPSPTALTPSVSPGSSAAGPSALIPPSQALAPSQPSIAAQISNLFGSEFNGSALAARHGNVAYSGGIGLADATAGIATAPQTRFRLGSITKQFTAMAILMLEARGEVGENDAVCRYLDACPNGWDAITIRHVLAHQSGIPDYTEQSGWDPAKPTNPAKIISSVAGLPLQWTPGERFGYSNSGYVLLGMVIERASGLTYESFLAENIFKPLGMNDSGYDHDGSGLAMGYSSGFTPASPIDMSQAFAAGALYSSVLDMQRWDEALYGDVLVSPPFLDRFFAPIATATDQPDMGYAYGVYVGRQGGLNLASHDGGINGFTTYYVRFPDEHVCVVLLTNRERGPNLYFLAREIADLIFE
jgi:CubicO group peptidase (beta-lactamase class C family)